jgi:hypothetical protein
VPITWQPCKLHTCLLGRQRPEHDQLPAPAYVPAVAPRALPHPSRLSVLKGTDGVHYSQNVSSCDVCTGGFREAGLISRSIKQVSKLASQGGEPMW